MRQVVLVARDDEGQPCSNEAWADQVRYLAGVESVVVHTEGTIITACRPHPLEGRDVTFPLAVNGAETVRAGSGFVGPDSNQLMFASKVAADVDAYVNRQAERMGHTEIHRG